MLDELLLRLLFGFISVDPVAVMQMLAPQFVVVGADDIVILGSAISRTYPQVGQSWRSSRVAVLQSVHVSRPIDAPVRPACWPPLCPRARRANAFFHRTPSSKVSSLMTAQLFAPRCERCAQVMQRRRTDGGSVVQDLRLLIAL
jgi:hypothetical protein